MTSVAKLYSATGSEGILDIADPIFRLSYRYLLVALGLVEIAIAGYILYGAANAVKCAVLASLSSCFIIYRVGVLVLGVPDPCPCLGTITAKLPFGPATADLLLKGMIAYLLLGSLYYLLRRSRCTVIKEGELV